MENEKEYQNNLYAGSAPSLVSSVETIKSRIESELTTLRTRIHVKEDKLAKLSKKVDEVRKAREIGDSMLNGEDRQRLVEGLTERTLQIESDIQDVERITLSTNHARKSCHVPVYISKMNCVYFLVSPGVTCATLVHQILGAMLHDNPTFEDKYAKYLRMRRRGEKESEIIRQMRRDKVPIEPGLFEAPEYTLVCNQGRKPGSWEEVDLLSPELRHEDAIHFLTSLALDPARGFGVNGSSIEQSKPHNPSMLPPLYFVKRAAQGFLEKEEFATASASPYTDSKNSMSGIIREVKSSRNSLQSDTAAITGVPLSSQANVDDLPKGLAPKQKNMSAYYSLADDRSFGATRASGNDQSSFVSSIGGGGTNPSSLRRPPTLKSWTENPEKDEEAGGGSFRHLSHQVKECIKWCMAPRVSRLSRFQTSRFDMSAQPQSSAFEAFATLILFGEPVEGNQQSTLRIENTKQRRERILSKAADLMDFAWLGRESASARLYCKQLGLALGLDRPPRHVWAKVFSGIAHGSGDRLAHSVDFDEFHMQYPELRSAPYVENDSAETYGDKIDELVLWFKSELKATYKLVDVPIPPKIWGRRFRTIAMLAAFVVLIVASLENSNNFVEIANSFPSALQVQNNFTETYAWSTAACKRLARSDINDVVLRQQRVSAKESMKCPAVQLLPEFNLLDPNTTSLINGEWSAFQHQVFLATSAHGRFSDYDESGYILSNAGKGRYGSLDSGLDVSTRGVLLDFDLYNEALNVAAHGTYVTEFDSSGNVVSRLVLNSKSTGPSRSGENSGSETTFQIYAIIATVLIGAAALGTTFQFLLSLRANSSLERFPFTTLFVVVAFVTSLPLIFTDYNSNLLAVSSLSLAYCLGVMMYSLERSWMWVPSVFDNNRLRLFSIFVQYALFIILYSVALEGWYNDRTYLTFHYGQTAVAASILGIVPGYIHLLFPRNQNDFGDAISVLFGLIFVLVAGTLIYVFFAIVIFGFRSKPHDPNWGLFSIKSRRMYQPVE